MVPGRSIRAQNSGIVGFTAQNFLHDFRADHLIMSLGALDEDGTMLDFDFNEVAVVKIMMNNAKKIWVAADSTKYGASASVAIGHVSEIDALFSDSKPSAALESILEHQQVELICC